MNIHFPRPANFDLGEIFDCGQCFRFSGNGVYEGVAFGRFIRVYAEGSDIVLEGASEEDFNLVWRDFFDLDRNYSAAIEILSRDPHIAAASAAAAGIRILRQDLFECLISFIISQNNNIPRIKKIVATLCENFGEPIDTAYGTYYSFPDAQSIFSAGIDELSVIRAGFRSKYIIDACGKILSGEVDLEALRSLSTDDLIESLKKIKGVGVKIASCVALFAYGRFDAFPEDIWIKRVLKKYYPAGFDARNAFGEYAGLAQQYMYHYERNLGLSHKMPE
ncbi:8-oxoguanine DNA glycosylase [Clostridia bacterium]|nr:8-oxoguanine DNA glycosylase [Clostridia bacterium]